MLLYWLCVNRRSATSWATAGLMNARRALAAITAASGTVTRCCTHARTASSSVEPGSIFTPPTWRVRLVGLLSSNEREASSRSIKFASVSPNASISSGLADSRGKCSLVPDATPSSLWQLRQFAFWKIGYTVLPKLGAGACASTTVVVSCPYFCVAAMTPQAITTGPTAFAKATAVRRSFTRRRKPCATVRRKSCFIRYTPHELWLNPPAVHAVRVALPNKRPLMGVAS